MKILFVGLLALAFWAPLPFGSKPPWAWPVLVVGATLLASIWLGGFALGRFELTPAFRRAKWAVGILVLWLAYVAGQFVPLPAQWVELLSPNAFAAHRLVYEAGGSPIPSFLPLSVDAHATRDFWFKSVAYVCVFALTLLVVDSRQRLETLLRALVIFGTLQAMYATVMVLSGLEYGFFIKKFAGLGQATGTFLNRNHLAGYLNICLALGIGLMIAKLGGAFGSSWRERVRSILRLLLGEKTRLRIYLIVMVIGIVMTRSRMGNTAFFASTLIVGVLGLLLMRNAPRTTVYFLVSLVALDVLIVGTWFGVDQVANRINSTEVHLAEKEILPREDREKVAEQTLLYIKDFPLTGSGGGTYYVTFPAYKNEKLVSFYDYTHNDYLQFAAETGLIGLGICAVVVLLAAWQALVALRRRNDPLMRGTAFGVAMAISWLAIHSTVDFNMQIPANALTMSIVLALAWISNAMPGGPDKHATGERRHSGRRGSDT